MADTVEQEVEVIWIRKIRNKKNSKFEDTHYTYLKIDHIVGHGGGLGSGGLGGAGSGGYGHGGTGGG